MQTFDIKKLLRYQIVFALLFLLLIVSVVLNINTGSVNISAQKIFQIIFTHADPGSIESNIIWRIRLPRLLSAAVLGGALAVSGFLMQTFFRNPIAGPFVLGISSGAKMFVGFTMIILLKYVDRLPAYVIVLAAFCGSLLSMGFVLIFAQRVSNMSMLLVVGMMISYICSAITDFFVTFARESEIANLTAWSMGSFSGSTWGNLRLAAAVVLPAVFASFLLSKPIGAYQLGEGYAKSMGINIKLFRVLLIILSSLLAGCVTAFAGPISFVGIAVPHITKLLMHSAKPAVVIPASFLCGAVFCMLCDLVARTAFSPTELAIGTVTSIFGAPIVIWLMVKRKKNL